MSSKNLLATIDNWGPQFRVSLDLKINSKISTKWSSVMAFKGNGGTDEPLYGDRVPVIGYDNEMGGFTNK